jgi:hypothetical protein
VPNLFHKNLIIKTLNLTVVLFASRQKQAKRRCMKTILGRGSRVMLDFYYFPPAAGQRAGRDAELAKNRENRTKLPENFYFARK